MKNSLLFQMLICLMLVFAAVDGNAQEENQQEEERKIIILASSKDYHQLVETAKTVSTKLGIPYSARGMIFDASRGLILPDNHEDEAFAGSYYLRRYNADCGSGIEECLSIEKSDEYKGFTPGLYVLVAGIYEANDPLLAQKLANAQKAVPDAYAKSTKIYLGCMH